MVSHVFVIAPANMVPLYLLYFGLNLLNLHGFLKLNTGDRLTTDQGNGECPMGPRRDQSISRLGPASNGLALGPGVDGK